LTLIEGTSDLFSDTIDDYYKKKDEGKPVLPFIELRIDQVDFNVMKMDDSIIKLNSKYDGIGVTDLSYLSAGFTGMHVITPYFDYLNTKFFSNVCDVSRN
jgi:hypothetical protein